MAPMRERLFEEPPSNRGQRSVADTPAGGKVNVYASWNGATEIATWEVLGGADATKLASLGTFPRTDFETVMAVTPKGSLVAVNARDASGAVLGTSRAVAIPD